MATAVSDARPHARVEARAPRRPQTRAGLLQCLVVSESRSRCHFFQKAAAASGWETLACRTSAQADLEIRKTPFQLVIIDLDGYGDARREGFRQLAEQLADDGGPLLMMCGGEEDALEEIWARQLGAWLYLPGVDASCDVAMLCREAVAAVRKMHSSPALGIYAA